MSPAAVLEAHRGVVGPPPESWVLAIRGERFELGEPLSSTASAHLDAAVAFFVSLIREQTQHPPAAVSTLAVAEGAVHGRRIEVLGVVQGVGFRPWALRTARSLGLAGEVWNTTGNVTVDAFGPAAALDAFVSALHAAPPGAARIRSVRTSPIGVRDVDSFTIGGSVTNEGRDRSVELALPADLATCAACLRDMDDATGRFYRYPFTSCTDCGPRLSIALDLPYDRVNTTMGGFTPCLACAREYADPDDRRFHSQTVACVTCGPRAWFVEAKFAAVVVAASEGGADPIDEAAARILGGAIVGVQGLGAFHLVCDATQAEVVGELRRRKRRDAQPFAVMVADIAMAEELAELDADGRAALLSAERPIVLAPARPGASVAAVVNGPSRRTGVMLPYTPLHHRLAAAVGRPLVVTSGNPSGGPPIIDRAEAIQVLGPLVDAFLFHDRPIARRVEDSVIATSDGAGLRVVRRSRGFAPLPIRMPAIAPEPVLAVGGHTKNTACIVVGDEAYLTPHMGDLELVESEAAWRRDLASFERLLGVRPEVIAHDLHPDYATTRFALSRPARRRVGVQHHVAHVLATVAELHIDEPVVGLAFDGSGWGTDGTSWGGEILLVDGLRWSRASTFRPLPLPGGERAIRQVWRVALAALCDAFGDEGLSLTRRLRVFDGVPWGSLGAVGRMIETGVEVVPARGIGRWFDAIGALALGLPHASFDGHVAVALEEAAVDLESVLPYPVALPASVACEGALDAGHEIDLRPTVRAVVKDLLEGRDAGTIAACFHHALVEATANVVLRVLAATGVRQVVLTGGSLQNRALTRGLLDRLGADRVRMAREVPLNDGGLALGQAWAAVLALRADRA